MRAHSHAASGQICPYCRSSISESPTVRCGFCGTSHHDTCWSRQQGCSVFGCANSIRRYHRFTFRIAIAAVLLPVFVLMIVMLALFSSATLEFGTQVGFKAVRDAIPPVFLLTTLLFCGFYSFYIEWIHGARR